MKMKKEEKEDKVEIKVCKKCKRPLPEKYRYKDCEACRNKKANIVKKVGAGIGAGALAIGGAILTNFVNNIDFKK